MAKKKSMAPKKSWLLDWNNEESRCPRKGSL